MKTAKLLKIALVLTAIFTFSACEEEEITIKNTNGDTQVEASNNE